MPVLFPIESKDDLRECINIGDTLAIGIWLHTPWREVQRALREQLKKRHVDLYGKNKRGRPSPDNSGVWYPLYYPWPDTDFLKTALEVYDLRVLWPDWTLWEIWEYVEAESGTDTADYRNANSSDTRKVATAIVSRYLRKAKTLIANVGRGVFPMSVGTSHSQVSKVRRMWLKHQKSLAAKVGSGSGG